MKTSLGAHKNIDALGSSEQFFEFVRALFMISLALAFSPVLQDRNLAEYIQQLSIELYHHLCNHNKIQRVTRLQHSTKSVKLINISLTLLGLPHLLGIVKEKNTITRQKDYDENLKLTIQEFGKESVDLAMEKKGLTEHQKHANDHEENEANLLCSYGNGNSGNLNLLNNKDTSSIYASNSGGSANQILSKTEHFTRKSSSASEIKNFEAALYETVDTSKQEGRANACKTDRTFRGWTYNFGHETRLDDVILQRKECQTFPFASQRKPLDPKKQWQTYKHKCVGLPVDPNFFASPVPTYQTDNEVSRIEEHEDIPKLVNLSVPYIKRTLENRGNSREKPSQPRHEYQSLVNREKTTVFSTDSVDSTEALPQHPHDIPNQPMKPTSDNNNKQTNDEVDASQFAPLVDLTKITMNKVLDVHLGESVSTCDPVEYINNWEPPSQEGLAKGNTIRSKYSCCL